MDQSLEFSSLCDILDVKKYFLLHSRLAEYSDLHLIYSNANDLKFC